jgi:hypothetical protein
MSVTAKFSQFCHHISTTLLYIHHTHHQSVIQQRSDITIIVYISLHRVSSDILHLTHHSLVHWCYVLSVMLPITITMYCTDTLVASSSLQQTHPRCLTHSHPIYTSPCLTQSSSLYLTLSNTQSHTLYPSPCLTHSHPIYTSPCLTQSSYLYLNLSNTVILSIPHPV